MESVPNEVVDLIIKNLDLETNYNLSLANSKMYSSTKRHLKPTITYYKNGRVDSKTWISRNESGEVIKRVIDYFNNAANSKRFETWYKNDLLHREGKPAYHRWDINGNKVEEIWYENNFIVPFH